MQIGTQKLWTQANGHTYQTHCKNGHEFNDENTYISPKSQKRTCRICNSKRVKERWNDDLTESRRKAAEHMREWRAANPERNRKSWTELRKQKKAWLEEYKLQHPCTECGENDPVCLDFHHRDPTQKEANLSVAIAHWSIDKLQMEVAKCDILCSNCHRKLHWQERNK